MSDDNQVALKLVLDLYRTNLTLTEEIQALRARLEAAEKASKQAEKGKP